MPQVHIPAVYYRGGTSKGIFFKRTDLPKAAQQAGEARDKILLRILGSPDPYGKQIDGLGNASSSTSKAVIIDKSTQPDHDIDYLFGQVSIDRPFVDWSGNCGNLTAAVGAFAISQGLISPEKIPLNGICTVKIWQQNIQKTIIAHIPISDGLPEEEGEFMLDGVAFPAAEIRLEFLNPADNSGALFPTGNPIDTLDIPTLGRLKATLIQAGIPTIFIHANDIGCTGTELQSEVNTNPKLLALLETIRAHGAIKMGLINHIEEAAQRAHTPKIAFVAPPQSYTTSSGTTIAPQDIDILVRAMSMGQLHHAMMGTAAVAIAAAAAVPDTLVAQACRHRTSTSSICFGHPSGTLKVGATAQQSAQGWHIERAEMSRSARRIMSGEVYIPSHILHP